MTLRTWQCVMAASGVFLLPMQGGAQGTPRYQSPFTQGQATTVNLPRPEAITPNGTVVEDAIARINDQIISRSDLERAEAQLQQELQQTNASPSEREEKQRDLLRDMVDQQLLLSKGKELGLNADTELVRRLDEIRKQNHLDSLEDLEKAARQQGVNYEDFKANIRNGVITQQVVRDEVGRRLQLTQGQEQAYYDAHKNEFQQPEQVKLSEILIPAPADGTEAQLSQAKAKADGVEAKLRAGTSFEELAKQNSGGQTAAQGGDLGMFKRGALAKVLEDQTFELAPGQSTAPIRTRQGYVILKVTEHQQAGVPPLKEVEPQVQEAMYVAQMAPALRTYLTKLREDAYIDIKPGFVDSGASPRQTKPVFTSYQAPTPKKKNQQKGRLERTSFAARPAAKAPGDVAALPAGTGPALVPDANGNVAGREPGDVAAAVSTPTPTTSGKQRESARLSSTGKQKRIRREKVRFGQAPRDSLPAGPEEAAQTGADQGAGAQSASTAPGAAFASPPDSTTQFGTPDADPLAPKVVSNGKTRFSSRDAEFRAEKLAAKQTKVKEKITATPPPPTRVETATEKTQASPLGLNGDTVKKKKKVKEKGAAKERLQEKKPDTTAPEPVAPTVNPALAGTPGAPTQRPANSNDQQTTLPASDAPAGGAPPQGQPLSPTGAPRTTPNGTPAPQPESAPVPQMK